MFCRCASEGRLIQTGGVGQFLMKKGHTVGEGCRAGLKNASRRNFVHMLVAYGLHGLPSGARADGFVIHLHSAPGCKDDLGIAAEDFVRLNDPFLGFTANSKLGKDHASARSLDQLLNPADTADQRIITTLQKATPWGDAQISAPITKISSRPRRELPPPGPPPRAVSRRCAPAWRSFRKSRGCFAG